MMFRKKTNTPSQLPLILSFCVCVLSGLAALAQADFRNSGLARIEQELSTYSKLLSLRSEPWASKVKNRIDFAQFKIQNAFIANNLAEENLHLKHACHALFDERALLIEAQLAESGDAALLEKLIEQTFSHREILGCGE